MLAGVHHLLDFASVAALGVLGSCEKHCDTVTVSMQPHPTDEWYSPRLSASIGIADAPKQIILAS